MWAPQRGSGSGSECLVLVFRLAAPALARSLTSAGGREACGGGGWRRKGSWTEVWMVEGGSIRCGNG